MRTGVRPVSVSRFKGSFFLIPLPLDLQILMGVKLRAKALRCASLAYRLSSTGIRATLRVGSPAIYIFILFISCMAGRRPTVG
nr:hypothetical protein Q903MT_gene2531 [Picea sitchensis]